MLIKFKSVLTNLSHNISFEHKKRVQQNNEEQKTLLKDRKSESQDFFSQMPKEIRLQEIYSHLSQDEVTPFICVSKKLRNELIKEDDLFRVRKITDVKKILFKLSQTKNEFYPELLRRLQCVYCLDLSRTDIHDDQLEQLLSYFPNVRSIDLFWCDYLTDKALMVVAKKCPDLESLNVSQLKIDPNTYRDFTYQGIRELIKLKHLKYLDVSNLVCMTNSYLKEMISKLRELEVIDLSGCYKLDDLALKDLGKLHQLKSVDVSWCHHLTDDTIRSIVTGCPDLEELNLSGCDRFTYQGCREINKAKNIKMLDFSACDNVNEVFLAELSGLKHLEKLSLPWCDHVTDKVLAQLVNFPELVVLDLYSCPQVTYEGLKKLDQCPKLSWLKVCPTPQLTAEQIDLYEKEHPEVVVKRTLK